MSSTIKRPPEHLLSKSFPTPTIIATNFEVKHLCNS